MAAIEVIISEVDVAHQVERARVARASFSGRSRPFSGRFLVLAEGRPMPPQRPSVFGLKISEVGKIMDFKTGFSTVRWRQRRVG
jgi:hypothetical protein